MSDDDYNDCILDPSNDRRIIICDSHNKSDGIIQCIGSIESQYIPDEKTQQTEKTHGTGTVIHIDNKNNIYVLTAAHNILVSEKKCGACKTKTLKTYCPNKNCASPHKTKKTSNLIKPTHIYFSRRGHGIKHTLGQTVERYQVEEYKLPNEYYKFPTPRGGYDIGILIIKCDDKNGIDLYSKNCLNICLVNDETFGGEENILNMYGFPGEKRKEENHRIYYYLFGMSSSKLDKTNKFNIAKHEQTNKFYVVNKGIDTTCGQSGSCIYSYSNNNKNKYLIYGVHSGGSQKKRANWATFFDINNIEWVANVLLDNVISNKFVSCHNTLLLSRELHKQNVSIQSEKEKEKESEKEKEKEKDGMVSVIIILLAVIIWLIYGKGVEDEFCKEKQSQQNEETDYLTLDYFDTNLLAKGMSISNPIQTITNENVGFFSGYNTCYGTKVIPSSTKNKTYIWKFKNIQTHTAGLYIGIDNAKAKWVNSDFDTKTEKACYAYYGSGGEIYGWNQKTKEGHDKFRNKGDILSMKLSFNENFGVLSFKVNNGKEFIATNNVAQHNQLKYRMAVRSNSGSTIHIELLDFKEI